MGVLYDAIEREEGAITGSDGIIITYNKESSTWSWVASLCRGESEL